MSTGRFIVLEGLDGSGTTSQAEAIAAVLRQRGRTVLQTREPTDGSIGRQIREHLRADRDPPADPHVTALLFAADRLVHLEREVAPALARGEIVLCDRYVVSSWVYQGLDCDPGWVRRLNERARWPDLTLMVRVPPEVALARVHQRSGVVEIYDRDAAQRRLASAYDEVAAEGLPGFEVVDGDAPLGEVTDRLLAVIDRLRLG